MGHAGLCLVPTTEHNFILF